MEFKNVEIKVDLVEMANDVHKFMISSIRLNNSYTIRALWFGISIGIFLGYFMINIMGFMMAIILCILYCCITVSLLYVIQPIIFLDDDLGKSVYNLVCKKDVRNYVKEFGNIISCEDAVRFLRDLPFENEYKEDLLIWCNLNDYQFFMGTTDGTILLRKGEQRILWDIDKMPDCNITRKNIDKYKLSINQGDIEVVHI